MELRLFFSAHCLMVAYICTKFHENILNGIKLQCGHDFQRKNFKGHDSVKNVDGVTIFFCISSDGSLYLFKVP